MSMSIGLRIKQRREELGMTQEELSKASGVSRTTIWALENGTEHSTTTKTLRKLADALSVTIEQLFFRANA